MSVVFDISLIISKNYKLTSKTKKIILNNKIYKICTNIVKYHNLFVINQIDQDRLLSVCIMIQIDINSSL